MPDLRDDPDKPPESYEYNAATVGRWIRAHPKPLAVLGAVIVVAVAWIAWPAPKEPVPEPTEVVLAYLDAIRDGDVAGALAMTGHHPEGDTAVFLQPGALDRNWSVTATRAKEVMGDWTDDTTVDVNITAADGRIASGTFSLTREDVGGPWTLANPFIRAVFRPSPLWYVEVNGVTAPYELPQEASGVDSRGPGFLLLPGVYRFYSDVPGLLDVDAPTLPLLPGSAAYDDIASTVEIPAPNMTVAPEGEQAVQRAVNALIDECAALHVLVTEGCPFGVRTLDSGDSRDNFTAAKEVDWSIDPYPIVAAAPESEALALTDRRKGTATLTATGYTNPDPPKRVTMTCDVVTTTLEAGVLPGGELRVIPSGHRFRADGYSADPILWDTCR